MSNRYRSLYNLQCILEHLLLALDESVGKVVQALKDAQIYQNSLIVFSTDNGGDAKAGSSNYPLRGNKNTLYDGGIKL